MAIQRLPLSAHNFSIMEFARPEPEVDERWDLNPPYQRGEVWDADRQRNLVWSLLRGIPIGSVYLNARNHRDNPGQHGVVIDGKQRITAMRAFTHDALAVPAEWFASDERGDYIDPDAILDEITHDGVTQPGVRWSHLTSLGRGLFSRSTVGVVEATVDSIEAEAEIYLLVNFGGVDQTDDDRARAAAVAGGAE